MEDKRTQEELRAQYVPDARGEYSEANIVVPNDAKVQPIIGGAWVEAFVFVADAHNPVLDDAGLRESSEFPHGKLKVEPMYPDVPGNYYSDYDAD